MSLYFIGSKICISIYLYYAVFLYRYWHTVRTNSLITYIQTNWKRKRVSIIVMRFSFGYAFCKCAPLIFSAFFSGICKENNAKTCPRTNPVLCFFFGRFYQYDPHGIGRVVKKYTCLTSATSISISLHLSLLMITSSRSVDHGIGSLLNPWTSVTFLPLFCSSRMASRGLFFFFLFFLLQIFVH